MVAMRVGDEYMRHCFATYGVEQRADMRGIVGTRIDDRDLAAAEDVADRPLEGKGTRVVGHDPPHARHGLVHHARREIESLVEGNVVGHLLARPLAGLTYHYFIHSCTLANGDERRNQPWN